jgi:hypothetical protein
MYEDGTMYGNVTHQSTGMINVKSSASRCESAGQLDAGSI